MKRPRFWFRWLAFFIVLIVVIQYVLLTWLIPRYAVSAIRQFSSGEVGVGAAKISPRLTAQLTGVHSEHSSSEAAFRIEQLALYPHPRVEVQHKKAYQLLGQKYK